MYEKENEREGEVVKWVGGRRGCKGIACCGSVQRYIHLIIGRRGKPRHTHPHPHTPSYPYPHPYNQSIPLSLLLYLFPDGKVFKNYQDITRTRFGNLRKRSLSHGHYEIKSRKVRGLSPLPLSQPIPPTPL